MKSDTTDQAFDNARQCKEDQKLFADTGNHHMHLCDGELVIALAIYRGNRYKSRTCNFAELKCVYTTDPGRGLEQHLVRNLKWHLRDMLYSYILTWVSKAMVRTYEAQDFFVIEYGLLHEDVKEFIPMQQDRVCMKFLLPDWMKNRFDLV